jgi:UDP-N-acetylmuramate--alanine ligase
MKGGHFHLMGVGGVHMSAIAHLLLEEGYRVSGCDVCPTEALRPLQEKGLRLFHGHNPCHLAEVDVLVHTAAIRQGNPELEEARRRGILVLKRAEMVARLAEGRRMVAVAGSHGKTTTTSLVAYMLWRAGLSPTFLLGGYMVEMDTNVAAGTGPFIVVEADEFDRAFLAYNPWLAVVTNVEPDHLDCYGTFEALKDAFRRFLHQVQEDGIIVACGDDRHVASLVPRLGPPVVSYGLGKGVDLMAQEAVPSSQGYRFRAVWRGQDLGLFQTQLWGLHNVSNCLAALAVGLVLDLPVDLLREALATFRGVKRRFQVIGEARGITVMDDYAHHPTEVRATLAAVRQRFPGRRLVCLFQPHTYSRSRYLLDGFLTCFQEADLLLVADTYAARESPQEGIDAATLAAQIGPHARYVGSLDDATLAVLSSLRPGDVFMTIGAGDVDKVAYRVLEELGG